MLEKLQKSIQQKMGQLALVVKENPILVAYLIGAVVATIYLGVVAFALNLALLAGLVLEEKDGQPSMSGDSIVNGVLPAAAMVVIGVLLSTSFAVLIAPVAGMFMVSLKAKHKNPLQVATTNLKKGLVRIKNLKQVAAKSEVVEAQATPVKEEEKKEESKEA
jgi:hypothetical protein